jgi:hypothetical protein
MGLRDAVIISDPPGAAIGCTGRVRSTYSPWKAATFRKMPVSIRQLAIVLAVALPACGVLSACGTINEKLAAGVSDVIPAWAGGMPADAPPRPGTAKYDEFMRERERKRLEPAVPADATARSNASLDPVH